MAISLPSIPGVQVKCRNGARIEDNLGTRHRHDGHMPRGNYMLESPQEWVENERDHENIPEHGLPEKKICPSRYLGYQAKQHCLLITLLLGSWFGTVFRPLFAEKTDGSFEKA